MSARENIPLVYACSGASSAAQMANHLAVRLDRLRVAEMSCIAGVGGDVKPLLNTARSGRPIIALDGCPLQCAAKILQRQGLRADKHVDLSELGVPKRQHEDFDPQQAAQVLRQLLADPVLAARTTPSPAPAPAPGGELKRQAPSPASPADDEIQESSSPPCYLHELKPPQV